MEACHEVSLISKEPCLKSRKQAAKADFPTSALATKSTSLKYNKHSSPVGKPIIALLKAKLLARLNHAAPVPPVAKRTLRTQSSKEFLARSSAAVIAARNSETQRNAYLPSATLPAQRV